MTEIPNIGYYFEDLFDNLYDAVTTEHQFQSLTESNKDGVAFRKGVYITPVTKQDDNIYFNLLRCSSNFEGPTNNFKDTDYYIVNKLNSLSKTYYKNSCDFNHILAQVYENNIITTDEGKIKEKKATIKAHSDKTKDMPENGLMAFCTFYNKPVDNPDALTSIQFKLKDCVPNENNEFTEIINIPLKPNSVLLVSLLTNRLYTHEIKAPKLSISQLPTRLGYVVRCSKTKAVYKEQQQQNGQTFIIDDAGVEHVLEPLTLEQMEKIKTLYVEENKTANVINYGNIYTSMNKGDYMAPIL